MPSTCSLGREDSEKRAPTGVHDGFREMVIFHHLADLKVFYHNMLIAFGIRFGCFEMMITPLTMNFEMRLGDILGSLTASMTALLASAHRALFASEGSLRRTIESRVLNRVSLAIGQERFQPNVNADIRMSTRMRSMLGVWVSLTDDQCIPMLISPINKVDGLGCALKLAMHLDLENVSQLLGDNEMRLVLMHRDIFAILPKTDRVPPVWCFETRKADTRKRVLFGGKKALEGLRETISEHLYRCGGNVLMSRALKSMFQSILTGERALLLILLFDSLQHSMIDMARLNQACHERPGLFLIHVQSVLKCFHVLYSSP